MAGASDSFLVINDVIMASLLFLKVIHMLATFLILWNTKWGRASIFRFMCIPGFSKTGLAK